MIYLVRHGQTAFNAERRLQGHVDSPLTEQGRAQAVRFGETLRGLTGPDAGWRIVASPLGRARATAEAIRDVLGWGEIELEPRLIEVSWGDWDGCLRSELEARHPNAFGQSGWEFRTPVGESYESVQGRMTGWLAGLPPEPERRIIAVSHGAASRVLRGVYARLTREAAVVQPVPQDAIYRLSGGGIERIDCEAVG